MSDPTAEEYGPFEPVDGEANRIFYEVMREQPRNIGYKPLIVTTRVIGGIFNFYLYMCNAQVIAPGEKFYPAEVVILKPQQGHAHIVSIKRVS